MKVIIAGSRSITDENEVVQAIVDSGFMITEVVSGGARGVDRIGEKWAQMMGIPVTRFIPDWEHLGKSAGHTRNHDMAVYVGSQGGLILVWDGMSSGSKNMLQHATTYELRIHQHVPNLLF